MLVVMVESKVIDFETESDLKSFLIETVIETKKEHPELKYFRLHVYKDGSSTASARVIITFHERIYDVALGRDIPHIPLSSNPHTTIPVEALEEFKLKWVQAEDTVNNVNYPKVLTYLTTAFVHLAK
jgi:hypothetical protein